jgi:hypothetical protein
LRKLASRTVETYPLEWRVAHEALQNAKDAIRKTRAPGEISIEFDVAAQSVTVSDTGVGFPPNRALLGFGGTDKDDDPDWGLNGRQGVGLKALILGTKRSEMVSVRDGNRWTLNIDDADGYLTGSDPTFTMTDPVPTDEPSGTRLTYSFRDTSVSQVLTEILERTFAEISDDLAGDRLGKLRLALEVYFRSYTYVGDVNALLNVGDQVDCTVNLSVVSRGAPTGALHAELIAELGGGSVDTSFPCKHWDVQEAVDRTRTGRPRATILTQTLPAGGALGRFNDNYLYIGKVTDVAGYESLLANPNLRRPIDPRQYDRLFEQLRGVYIAIGSRAVLEKYLCGSPRQFVAADGIPSAHVLPGPQRGGEATYVTNNIHFLVDVDAKLNYGKQTIPNPRLIGQINDFFADAVRATLRNVAISIVGSQIGTSSADDLEDQSRTETDVIARPLLASGKLHFKREPRDENALMPSSSSW